ncbi:MAG: nucleotidyltransferase domain-containing protein [Candidatus Sericytochromatia bacterium]
MDLKFKYQKALNQFINEEITKDIIGVFVTGSYVLNKLKQNSDIDVFIIHNKNYCQVLAKYINDIEFECSYKNLNQFYKDLENKNPIDIQRYSIAEVLYDPEKEVEKLISKSKEIFFQGSNQKISDSDKYHLEDSFKDLEDSINELEFEIILYRCFDLIIKFYFKKNNLWICKDKYLYDILEKSDIQFANLVKKFLLEVNRTMKYNNLLVLKKYILKDIEPLDKLWESNRF